MTLVGDVTTIELHRLTKGDFMSALAPNLTLVNNKPFHFGISSKVHLRLDIAARGKTSNHISYDSLMEKLKNLDEGQMKTDTELVALNTLHIDFISGNTVYIHKKTNMDIGYSITKHALRQLGKIISPKAPNTRATNMYNLSIGCKDEEGRKISTIQWNYLLSRCNKFSQMRIRNGRIVAFTSEKYAPVADLKAIQSVDALKGYSLATGYISDNHTFLRFVKQGQTLKLRTPVDCIDILNSGVGLRGLWHKKSLFTLLCTNGMATRHNANDFFIRHYGEVEVVLSRFNKAVNDTIADNSLEMLLKAYNKARLVVVDTMLDKTLKDAKVSFTKAEKQLIKTASTKTHLLASPTSSVAWYSDVITLAAQSATDRFAMEEKGAEFIFSELYKRKIEY